MGGDRSCGFVVWLTDSSPTLVFCQCYSVNDFCFVLIQRKLQYHIRIHTVALKKFKSRLFYQSSYCACVILVKSNQINTGSGQKNGVRGLTHAHLRSCPGSLF